MKDIYGRSITPHFVPNADTYTAEDGLNLSFDQGVTCAEVIERFNANPPAGGEFLANYAKFLLSKSDVTLLRCVERSIPIPASWQKYRDSLRRVAVAKSGAVPVTPAYPDIE